jgi:HNH endonuclease/NUMOD4 motif
MIDIVGYEGLYAVTTEGNVWAYPNRIHKGKFLKPSLKKGYLFVCLCKGSTIVQRNIHRIVAEAYLPNPENKPQVNHKDSNKLNNNLSNLEWCTASENKKHSWDAGTSIVTEAKREASRRNAYIAHTTWRKKHEQSHCSI